MKVDAICLKVMAMLSNIDGIDHIAMFGLTCDETWDDYCARMKVERSWAYGAQ